jgi:hypothetical protein
MTATELRAILEQLEWSQGQLAEFLHRDKRLARRMCQGTEPIDGETATWLREMVSYAPTLRRVNELMDCPPRGRASAPQTATVNGRRIELK